MSSLRKWSFLALLAGLSVSGASCNDAVPPVDRVQTNLVDKGIFEGEWWYTSTTIDVDYDEAHVFNSANAFAPFEGSMSTDYGLDYNRGGPGVLGWPGYSFPMARIRWVIDEKFLFAYRAFELVSGGNTDAAGPDFRGQPLAVYAIEDHVDVRKDYNATTGQKGNVTEENTEDRRWFERGFMRVDWSQNLLTQFAANEVQANELFTSFVREPVPSFFQEGGQQRFPESYKPRFVRVEDDPDYRFADEWPAKERDRVHYMSFVNQDVWSPSGSCLTRGGVCASVTATMRHSFLRVPPEHEYATRVSTHREFDRFGIFRSHQPTYARGGEDLGVQRVHCQADEDCGPGGACDNLARVRVECGSADGCREPSYQCQGGLTSDHGETDFLAFNASRHNLYADSLTDQSCVSDWECNGLYRCDAEQDAYELCLDDRAADCSAEESALDACLDPCDAGDSGCAARELRLHGSSCDPAARRCTLPLRERPIRPIGYRLSAHFPPYLVRDTFASAAAWNEVLMQGRRSVVGRTDIDQITARRWATDAVFQEALEAREGLTERNVSCAFDDGNDCDTEVRELSACAGRADDMDADCADELQAVSGCVCATDLREVGRVRCQEDDPTAQCFCGSPEETGGSCRMRYDPFEPPEKARARGVLNPYDCYVQGPREDADGRSLPIARAHDFDDYGREDYGYRFVGDECILTLKANSCDLDPEQPCEELGDIRHHFLAHAQHGAVGFGGVAQPFTDPTSGELVVSNATVAAESLESVGTLASQFFPVLRGEVPEDSYFTGENVRGYFANTGRVERPISTIDVGVEQGDPVDPSRPVLDLDVVADLDARMRALEPRMAKLQGNEGRAAILSDRVRELEGTELESRLASAVQADADPDVGIGTQSVVQALDDPMREVLDERRRKQALAARNMDDVSDALFNSQYHDYWAHAFKGRRLSEASIRMQQAYFRAVMLHEIGHAMGLRHNFAGSLDRNNYSDAYFNIARRTPLPAFREYDGAARGGNEDGAVTGEEAVRWAEDLRRARLDRLAQGAGNTMTSSVMDYSGDLSDFSGLGRYDRAAVLFNYFDRVEAYDTPSPTEYPDGLSDAVAAAPSLEGLEFADSHRRLLWTYFRGGDACRQHDDCPHAAGRETTAFQPITQRCLTNQRDAGPSAACNGGERCACSNFFDDFDDYLAGDAYRTMTDPAEYAEVSYLFCPDNRVDDLSWCTPSDAGESFQEVIDHYRLSWVNRYPQLYFRNYSRSGPRRGYSNGAVVDAVKVYQHLFFRYNYEGAEFRSSRGPLGYEDQLLASVDTFNWLSEIIGSPDVGSYNLDPDTNTYRKVSSDPNDPDADLNLPLGQGYYLWSEYQSGLNGFGRLERAGTFLDKVLAIQAIARRDWGLSFTVDERYYINFYDLFDLEVIDLFGGLIMRNPAAYAPRVDLRPASGPRVRYLSNYRNGNRGNTEDTYPAPAIDGTGSEVLRDLATIEALRTFPIFYDTSFEQRLLVFKLGSGEGYDVPAVRPDGTPTCAYGEPGCDRPDFITYESDRLHTTYVAVVLSGPAETQIDEQQLGFQILRRLDALQQKVRDLSVLAAPGADEQARLNALRQDLQRDESFVEYLIELERAFGISTYLF